MSRIQEFVGGRSFRGFCVRRGGSSDINHPCRVRALAPEARFVASGLVHR